MGEFIVFNDRDFSNETAIILHLCSVFTNMYEYVHGFSESFVFVSERFSLTANELNILYADLKTMFEDYVYYKIQYLKAKEGKALNLRVRSVIRKETQRLLSKEYPLEEVVEGIGNHS